MVDFWEWATNIISGFGNAWTWLTTPILGELDEVLGIITTPLVLVSFVGLVAFIGIAIGKWLIS